MVDRSAIGFALPPTTARVEAGRLAFFLKAIGDRNPAFGEAGSGRGTQIPPTYLFCLEMLDAPDTFAFLKALDIDLGRVLHGDQSFEYHAPVRVGDELTFASRVEDVFDKKGGALTFVVQTTVVTNQSGVKVATLRRSIVVRNPREAAA